MDVREGVFCVLGSVSAVIASAAVVVAVVCVCCLLCLCCLFWCLIRFIPLEAIGALGSSKEGEYARIMILEHHQKGLESQS